MALQPARGILAAARLFRPGSPEALLLLRAAWPLAVGPELARRTEVQTADAGTLRVAVPDGRWRKVLHRMRGDILSRLRAVAGGLVPRQMGFVESARVDAPSPPPSFGERRPEASAPSPCPPSVRAAADAISDAELRGRFLQSAARYLSRSSNPRLDGDDNA
jgi:Dna[CI] antecedent DciA-like protein